MIEFEMRELIMERRQNMLFIQYPKCSTCQKAKNWLDLHNILYTDRHIAAAKICAEDRSGC